MKDRSLKINGYRNTVNRCMCAMTALIACMFAFSLLSSTVMAILSPVLSDTAYEVTSSLLGSFTYAAMFLIPGFVFKLFSKNKTYFPLPARPVLPKHPIRITFASVGIVYSLSILSSVLMNFLITLMGYTIDMSAYESEINGVHSILLLFISTAVVPALVEEYLFRGVMLKNLLPYGKTVAVVVSALLFSLMHQNFLQFLYAFGAGIVLGVVFLKTGSIWCGVLIHFVNNFLSVLNEAFAYYLSEEAANKADYLLMTIVIFIGLISLTLIIKDAKKEKALKQGSVFGNTEQLPVFEGDMKLTEKEAVKNFFTPFTIVVIVAIVILALLTLGMTIVPMPA